MKFYLFLVAIAFGLAVAGDIVIKELLQMRNNNFTGRILSNVAQENPHKSLVLSAFSLLTPLAQLTMASEGDTHDELLNVIGFPNDYSITAVFSLINREMKTISGVDLKMANRIYIPLNYDLNDNFAALSKDIFKSAIENIDFTHNIDTAAKINKWVETETNHHIRNLINPYHLGINTKALLVNVLYFKKYYEYYELRTNIYLSLWPILITSGKSGLMLENITLLSNLRGCQYKIEIGEPMKRGTWEKQFDRKRTTIKPFYFNNEDYIMVPTMRKRETYKYGESYNLEAKILEMSYVGGESSMIIILPNKIGGIRSLLHELEDLTVLDQELTDLYEQEVDVFIPKFQIETEINVKNLLQNMNVTSVFGPEANLSKLLKSQDELFVSEAIQKSFIEINEEGAEASASNMVQIMIKASATPIPKFYANHPFMFMLRSNNINLFSGIYYGL